METEREPEFEGLLGDQAEQCELYHTNPAFQKDDDCLPPSEPEAETDWQRWKEAASGSSKIESNQSPNRDTTTTTANVMIATTTAIEHFGLANAKKENDSNKQTDIEMPLGANNVGVQRAGVFEPDNPDDQMKEDMKEDHNDQFMLSDSSNIESNQSPNRDTTTTKANVMIATTAAIEHFGLANVKEKTVGLKQFDIDMKTLEVNNVGVQRADTVETDNTDSPMKENRNDELSIPQSQKKDTVGQPATDYTGLEEAAPDRGMIESKQSPNRDTTTTTANVMIATTTAIEHFGMANAKDENVDLKHTDIDIQPLEVDKVGVHRADEFEPDNSDSQMKENRNDQFRFPQSQENDTVRQPPEIAEKDNVFTNDSFEHCQQTSDARALTTKENLPSDTIVTHVEFKSKQKHLFGNNFHGSSAVEGTDNFAFQNNYLTNELKPMQNVQTNQEIRKDSQPLEQSLQENANWRKKSLHESQAEETLTDANQWPSPQRHWTAYRSALNIQTRSKSTPAAKPIPGQAVSLTRSQSMQTPRKKSLLNRIADKTDPAPRKLLHQLSFSDSTAKNIRDYGGLRGGRLLPKKKPQHLIEESGNDNEEEIPKLPPEALSSIVGLLEELIGRGKIRQVAVLSQGGGGPIASLPTSWELPTVVVTGLIKAVMEFSQNLCRLTIDNQTYACMKHGPHRLVGHAEDDVLVVQRTVGCVVVALSADDTPGSCVHEVCELADILNDKGY